MRDYVEHLRAKPEHVRKTIALFAAVGVTAVVAVGWVVALLSSGGLALSSKPIGDAGQAVEASQQRFQDLAGAASAIYGNKTDEPSVTVVEEGRSSTLERTDVNQSDQTVLHF